MPEHPEVHQLAADLYSFEVPNLRGQSGQATNVYVVGREPVTLIDAGSDDGGATAMAALGSIGVERVARILLTHAHHDHAGSAHAIREATGASVLVAERDVGGSTFSVEADGHMLAGDIFISPPYTLKAVSTPGHAPGHLSFYELGLKVLFAGDLMSGFGSVAIVPPRGSMGDYLQSLRRVEQMDIETVYPGHGPVIANGAERIREYIEHRERRESEILQLIQAGVGHIEELTEQLYPDILPRFKPHAAGTVLAHIVHLLDTSKVRVEQEAPELSASRFTAI